MRTKIYSIQNVRFQKNPHFRNFWPQKSAKFGQKSVKVFFQMSLKNFLGGLETCCGYLEGVFNLVVYVGNKIRIIGDVHQNISQKTDPP